MINTYSPAFLLFDQATPSPAPRYPSPPPGLRLLRAQLGLLQRVAPGLALRLAWRVFCSPRRLPHKEWEAAALAGARRRTVAAPAGPVAAYEWGPAAAPAVVLVHGWELRAAFWRSWVGPLLAAGYRVVALDGPAHGASPGRQTNLVQFAEAVQAVVQAAAETGPIHALVGHSFGGAAITGLPVRLPAGAPLPRLLLLSVPLNLRAVASRFADFLYLRAEMVERIEAHVQRLTGRDPGSFAPAVAGRGMGAARVLVLHDEEDEIVPFAEGQQIVAAWPGAALHTTQGLGHNRLLRHPAVVQRALEFLA